MMIRFKQNLSAGRQFYQFWGKTSNCYLLVDRDEDATYLIDCGMPSDVPSLLKVLKEMPPLKRVVCTHFHVDHISGWIGLKQKYPGTDIWFHEKAGKLVSGQQTIPLPGYRAIKEILIPCMRMYGYRPNLRDIFQGARYGTFLKKGFPQDGVRFFTDGADILPGFLTLHTPGHRPDESSFLEPESGVFIAGDFLLVLAGKVFANTFVSSAADQQTSRNKIRQRREQFIVCPGHGECVPFSPQDI
jgi:glyoxylase-like metal-dependent hydrolase (beta-lactamase superfamily II)